MKGVLRVVRDIGLAKVAITVIVLIADMGLSSAGAHVRVRTAVLLINEERTGCQRFEEADPLGLRAELETFIRHFNDDVELGKRVHEEVSLAKRRGIRRVDEAPNTV